MITIMVKLNVANSDLTAVTAALADIDCKYGCNPDYYGNACNSSVPDEIYDREAEQYHSDEKKNNE